MNYDYPFRRPNTDRRGDIFLTDDEARELGKELRDLFERYLELPRDGSEKLNDYKFIYALVKSPG